MASNPLKQLKTIENAARNHQIITDCYRLLYREQLWMYVYNQKKHQYTQPPNCEQMIEQLKTGTFTFKRKTTEHLFLVDIIILILKKIYASTNDSKTKIMQKVIKTCKHQQWFMTFRLQGFSNRFIIESIRKRIKDPRFIQLIHQFLQMKKIQRTPRYNQFFIHIFSDEFASMLRQKHTKVKIFHLQGQFLLGMQSNIFEYKEEILQFAKMNHVLVEELTVSHAKKRIRYLDYDVIINHRKDVRLEIPHESINQLARTYQYGYFSPFTITHRKNLAYKDEWMILQIYNKELRQILAHYSLAHNQHTLRKLFYLAESSLIKTLAYKRKTTSKNIIKSLRRYKQGDLTIVQRNKEGKLTIASFIKWNEK